MGDPLRAARTVLLLVAGVALTGYTMSAARLLPRAKVCSSGREPYCR